MRAAPMTAVKGGEGGGGRRLDTEAKVGVIRVDTGAKPTGHQQPRRLIVAAVR